MLHLEYYNETKRPLSGQIFEELLEVINRDHQDIFPEKLDRRKNYFITCTMINDELMKKINKEHRGHDKPTDVVSLCYLGDEFPGDDMIGEIFISIDTAEKQAEKLHHDVLTEIKFLFVHGVLHVLGYEHATEEGFVVMNELTKKILT